MDPYREPSAAGCSFRCADPNCPSFYDEVDSGARNTASDGETMYAGDTYARSQWRDSHPRQTLSEEHRPYVENSSQYRHGTEHGQNDLEETHMPINPRPSAQIGRSVSPSHRFYSIESPYYNPAPAHTESEDPPVKMEGPKLGQGITVDTTQAPHFTGYNDFSPPFSPTPYRFRLARARLQEMMATEAREIAQTPSDLDRNNPLGIVQESIDSPGYRHLSVPHGLPHDGQVQYAEHFPNALGIDTRFMDHGRNSTSIPRERTPNPPNNPELHSSMADPLDREPTPSLATSPDRVYTWIQESFPQEEPATAFDIHEEAPGHPVNIARDDEDEQSELTETDEEPIRIRQQRTHRPDIERRRKSSGKKIVIQVSIDGQGFRIGNSRIGNNRRCGRRSVGGRKGPMAIKIMLEIK